MSTYLEIKINKKLYANRSVESLEGLNVLLPSEGLFLLKGKNGSGKTTLLNILSGMDTNYEGNININGENAFDKMPNYVFYQMQESPVFDDLTVFENLLLVNKSKKEIHHYIQKLGLTKVEKSLAGVISPGERQRLCIARSLLSDRHILLFDEPFASLDQENAKAALELIKEKRDKLIIVSSQQNEITDCSGIIDLGENKSFSFEEKSSSQNKKASRKRTNLFEPLRFEKKLFCIFSGITAFLIAVSSFMASVSYSTNELGGVDAFNQACEQAYVSLSPSLIANSEEVSDIPRKGAAYLSETYAKTEYGGNEIQLYGPQFSFPVNGAVIYDTSNPDFYGVEIKEQNGLLLGKMPQNPSEALISYTTYETLADILELKSKGDEQIKDSILNLSLSVSLNRSYYEFAIVGVYEPNENNVLLEAFLANESNYNNVIDKSILRPALEYKTSNLFITLPEGYETSPNYYLYPKGVLDQNPHAFFDVSSLSYLLFPDSLPARLSHGHKSNPIFYFTFLGLAFVYDIIIAVLIKQRNKRYFLLQRSLGQNRDSLIKQWFVSFALIALASSLIGETIGIGLTYLIYALTTPTSIASTARLPISVFPFGYLVSLGVALLGCICFYVYETNSLFKKDISTDLLEIKDR